MSAQILYHSFMAMFKIVLISSVGIIGSLYPEDNPLFTPIIMKSISRICSLLFIPALVVTSLGSSLSVQLLERFSILIVMCLIIIFTSYLIGLLCKPLHERNKSLYCAVLVAVGSPNVRTCSIIVSIPLTKLTPRRQYLCRY